MRIVAGSHRAVRSVAVLGLVGLFAALPVVGCSDDEAAGPPSTTAVASTVGSTTTTSAGTAPVECDADAMLAIVDDLVAEARLDPGEWDPAAATPFDDRTHPADDVREHLSFDCSLRAAQTTASGAERLLVAAWTFPRYGFVLQATDGPSSPYARAITFQLLFEVAQGEWIEDQFVWAATLEDGASVLIGAEDYSVGAVAKSWQSAFAPLPPGEVTLDAERYAMDALEAVGARSVAIAEEPEFGSEVGTIMFVTAAGQIVVATVAPPEWMDPGFAWLSGPTTTETVDGVEVRVTLPGEGEYDVADVGWACGEYGWRLGSGFGTPEELVALASDLIAHLGC